MTQPSVLLPDFVIIGAMKCGTTTLYRHLSDHPGVDMSRDKETDYFVAEKNWSRGPDWYSAQFRPENAKRRGEASPNYTKCRDFPGVAERMASVIPNARLIYIVRDPVVRVQSQFRHSFLMGDISSGLDDFAGSHEYEHILDASRYARQIEAYFACFPKEAILVLDFDDLVADPQLVMDSVARHIGVDPCPIVDIAARNDSSELSRVPAPILRFAQSRVGKGLAGLFSRDTRDRLRGMLALGSPRRPPSFPAPLVERVTRDLAEDADRFRALTGKAFTRWSI